jgi:hypothetical protein
MSSEERATNQYCRRSSRSGSRAARRRKRNAPQTQKSGSAAGGHAQKAAPPISRRASPSWRAVLLPRELQQGSSCRYPRGPIRGRGGRASRRPDAASWRASRKSGRAREASTRAKRAREPAPTCLSAPCADRPPSTRASEHTCKPRHPRFCSLLPQEEQPRASEASAREGGCLRHRSSEGREAAQGAARAAKCAPTYSTPRSPSQVLPNSQGRAHAEPERHGDAQHRRWCWVGGAGRRI